MNFKTLASRSILGMLLTIQIILTLFLYNSEGISFVRYIGVFFWISSIIFGWLPIYILSKKGKVPKGKSYIYTTRLIDTNIYSIVRHPQYLAGALLSLALILIAQNWFITIIGMLVISIIYIAILEADKHCIKKFGDKYKEYMKTTPQINFIMGVYRQILRKS